MPKVEINCLVCNQAREVFPSKIEHGGGKYCSKKCFYIAHSNASIDIWSYVYKKGPDECWPHIIKKTNKKYNYGRININRKRHLIHREIFQLANGPIPKKRNIINICKNESCCNDRHWILPKAA